MRRLVKKYYPTKTTNPCLMDEEDVLRMCLKSIYVFGSKWRWRKLCERANMNFEALEVQLDDLLAKYKKKVEAENEAERTRLNAGDSNGSSEVNGQEVRSGETGFEPTSV